MSGIHKTALFLSGLPEEASATLLQKLEPETASKVRVEMMRLKGTSKDKLRKTVAEFLDAVNTTEKQPMVPEKAVLKPLSKRECAAAYDQATANRIANTFDQEVTESGTFRPVPQTMDSFSQGIDYLTLETSRNVAPQEPVLSEPSNLVSGGLFGFLEELQAEQVRELLLFETPRVVAVLLTQLSAQLAGQILEQLTPEAQKEVVSILFDLEEIDEEILQEIEAVLRERAENIFGRIKKNIGHAAARRILQAINPTLRRHILDEKPAEPPAEIKQKKPEPPSFVFEDLRHLPDRGLREIFDSVDANTALLALVGAPQELIDRVFGKATPQQEKQMIRQYQSLAPIRPIDIESARQRLLKNFQFPT